jgi:putative hemolysin
MLSGMMIWLLGRLPSTGDISTREGWRLEVIDLDGRRIDTVLATALPESLAPPDGGRGTTETEAEGELPSP